MGLKAGRSTYFTQGHMQMERMLVFALCRGQWGRGGFKLTSGSSVLCDSYLMAKLRMSLIVSAIIVISALLTDFCCCC